MRVSLTRGAAVAHASVDAGVHHRHDDQTHDCDRKHDVLRMVSVEKRHLTVVVLGVRRICDVKHSTDDVREAANTCHCPQSEDHAANTTLAHEFGVVERARDSDVVVDAHSHQVEEGDVEGGRVESSQEDQTAAGGDAVDVGALRQPEWVHDAIDAVKDDAGSDEEVRHCETDDESVARVEAVADVVES